MKILVGYKGTNVGKDLMDMAVKHARAFEGMIYLVTSLVGGDKTEQHEITEAEKNLENAKAYFDSLGLKSETHLLIRGFEPGEDIVKFAKENQIDEIMIGVRSRSKVGKLIFWLNGPGCHSWSALPGDDGQIAGAMEFIRCLKALSDKTRLRLLYILRRYELNVNEIVLVVDMIQSGVSRHLKILLDSGLLTSRKDGSFTYYAAARNDFVHAFMALADKSAEREEINRDLIKAGEMIKIRQNMTRRFFKTVAPQWDQIKKQVLGHFDLNSMIIKRIPFQGSISDLGCGTGELIEMLSGLTPFRLVGIDSSPEMLEQARLRLLGKSQAELRLGELEHLPLKNREIRTVVMNMVLHHISQPELSLLEAFRILEPGGTFILSDFDLHGQTRIRELMGGSWSGFEKEKIETWLLETGFQLLHIDSFPVNQGLTINIFTAEKPKA